MNRYPIKTNKQVIERKQQVCTICNRTYTPSEFQNGKHSHCTACHQLIGRIKSLYTHYGTGFHLRRGDGNIPVFLPDIVSGIAEGATVEETLSASELKNLLPLSEDDMIAKLKEKGYRILKPTYTEV